MQLEKSMLRMRLAYGSDCPPRATLYGWVQQGAGGRHRYFVLCFRLLPYFSCRQNLGRPTHLTKAEEVELVATMKVARARGAVLDYETVITLARHVASAIRGADTPAPELTKTGF